MWEVLLFCYLCGGCVEIQVSKEVVFHENKNDACNDACNDNDDANDDDDVDKVEDIAFTEFHLYIVCHGVLARLMRGAKSAAEEEELVFQWGFCLTPPPWKLSWRVFLSVYLPLCALCAKFIVQKCLKK